MGQSQSKPILKWVPISLIFPNGVNPNQMSEGDFKQYVAEVRRLGRLPRPVVARRVGKKFQIVDGEHGWKAAKEVGLKKVLVEVIEADDYEMKLQCFKRNLGGESDPVVLGEMFEGMKADKDFSNRELAADLGVSEGSVRNALGYSEAAKLRKRYANEDGREEIAKLGLRQVRTYLNLPEEIGNLWLDAGADMAAWDQFPPRMYKDIAIQIQNAGLTFLLKTTEDEDGKA